MLNPEKQTRLIFSSKNTTTKGRMFHGRRRIKAENEENVKMKEEKNKINEKVRKKYWFEYQK